MQPANGTPAPPPDESRAIGPQLADFPDWMRELFIQTGSTPELLEDIAMLAVPTGTFGLNVAQIGGRPAVALQTSALLDLTLFQQANRALLAGPQANHVAWAEVMRAQPLGFIVLIVAKKAINAQRWAELKACGIHVAGLLPEPPPEGADIVSGAIADREGLLGDLLRGSAPADDVAAPEPDPVWGHDDEFNALEDDDTGDYDTSDPDGT